MLPFSMICFRLTVSVGTRLLLVKFIDFANVFVQLADSKSKSEFVEHREKIAAYGLKSNYFNFNNQLLLFFLHSA